MNPVQNVIQSITSRLPQWDSLTWVALLLGALVVGRGVFTVALRESETRKGLLELIDSGLIALVLVFFVIRPFIVQAFYIPSGSMEPTLYGNEVGGDRILVCKWLYRFREPQHKEIVVFSAPPEADHEIRNGQNKDFIKRLIGLPGDVVEVQDGAVYINGQRSHEPYLKAAPNYRMRIIGGKVISDDGYYGHNDSNHDRKLASPSEPIPEGKLLVLGDNRNNSNDSHKWGLLDLDRVLGRAMFIFWPPLRIRLLDGTEAPPALAQSKTPGTPAFAD